MSGSERTIRACARSSAPRAADAGVRGVKATIRRGVRRYRQRRYAEHDFYLRATATVPDDPLFSRQYGLPAAPGVSATSAWDHRTSCGKVATLDSGMQLDHPDLEGDLWHNPDEIKGNHKDDDHNGYVDDYYGVDIYDGSGGGADADGHGTHVAGIVAAHGDNGVGVAGVCWKAQIMPIRFMNANGRGSTSDAVAGIEYAIHEHAKVLNCSFGSSSKSSSLSDAINDAKSKGVLLVVAAGNDGESIDKHPEYPAAYTALSGTSMAAPFVAGAAAMLRAKDSSLSTSDVKSVLEKSVDKLPALGGKTVTGGRINLARALGRVG